jgi:hypothetical protein
MVGELATELGTEAVHLCVSVNRFSSRCVKGTAASAELLDGKLPLGSCHGVASWHGGRCN